MVCIWHWCTCDIVRCPSNPCVDVDITSWSFYQLALYMQEGLLGYHSSVHSLKFFKSFIYNTSLPPWQPKLAVVFNKPLDCMTRSSLLLVFVISAMNLSCFPVPTFSLFPTLLSTLELPLQIRRILLLGLLFLVVPCYFQLNTTCSLSGSETNG